MSKKAGKKTKVKMPEIDPNSPEWIEEVARKQSEAYDLVRRAMIRSQIDVELSTRDDLVKQKAELETKAKQQSQDQSDVYQYLRNKLKDNYVAIAELENQVSTAHDERLMREKQLITTISNLNEERESEKKRLEERLASLDVELTAIKEYQENSEVYEQRLKEMEGKITGCKDAFNIEVTLLNNQLEEEWETGRRDKEERRKITKKAAAKATQEQLGPRTKHRIAQNKKMMSELRFQCFEVEKMHRARQGLIKSNTLLLAQAASARYRVEDLARRSHLLQRIIRYMNQKLQSRRASLGDFCAGAESGEGSGVEDGTVGHMQRGWSAGIAGTTRGAGDRCGDRGIAGEGGALYKLAGMSEEERQQMLDLREELRREEVSIAAAQAVAGKLREEMLAADEERSRALALKTDVARALALCHEDPLVGNDARHAPRTAPGRAIQFGEYQSKPARGSRSVASSLLQMVEGSTSSASPRVHDLDLPSDAAGSTAGNEEGYRTGAPDRCLGSETENTLNATTLPAIDDCVLSSQTKRQEQRNHGQNRPPPQMNHQQQVQKQEQHQHPFKRRDHATLKVPSRGETIDHGMLSSEVHSLSGVGVSQKAHGTDVRGLTLWPESVALPSPAAEEMANGEDGSPEGGGEQWNKGDSRYMSAGVLRGVARLFLSKLQVSVEAITPRPLAAENETCGFPALASRTSLDGGGSAFGIGTNAGQICSSRRGPRHRADSRRAKRKGVGGCSTAGVKCSVVGRRLCRGRGGAFVCGFGGGDDGGDHSTLSDECKTEDEFRGSGGGHELGNSKRGEPDDSTSSWSNWHPTGIPSWDILGSAVRQTKRQRTRDAACQTLTYRQLRDGANTTASKRNNPTSCKHAKNNAQPPSEEAPQARPRQGQHNNETGFHVVPASRFISMLNPPSCPLSSATTASTASVYRVTDGGGLVHGAIVRGGTRGTHGEGRRRGIQQGQARMAGRGVPASIARQRGLRGNGPTFFLATDGEESRGLFNLPLDGEGMMLCTPAPSSQQQAGPLHDHQQQPEQDLPAPAQSLLKRPGATGDRCLSPTLGQVAVSWGRETEHETAEKMQGLGPSTTRDPVAIVPSCLRAGREPRSVRSDRDIWEARCYDLLSRDDGPEISESADGESFAYQSLSKGPDYRKVLLFTVDDADCRILRHSRASPARPERAEKARCKETTSCRDAVGTANGRRCENRSPSRQRGRVAARTNIMKSLSSPAAPKAVEARLAEATAAELSGISSVGVGLLIGNNNNSGGKDKSTRGTGGRTSTRGGKNSIGWKNDGGMEGPDGGRTLCSSLSTLSGEVF
ncbi:unnamed protein product [Hapterophycus canaliculatus]